jgi:hypothetical protein
MKIADERYFVNLSKYPLQRRHRDDIKNVDADVSRDWRRLPKSEWPLTGPGESHGS